MPDISVEIEHDELDRLTVENLEEMRDTLAEMLEEVKDGVNLSVFSTDWLEDRKQLKKTLKAFDRVIGYLSPVASHD